MKLPLMYHKKWIMVTRQQDPRRGKTRETKMNGKLGPLKHWYLHSYTAP